MARKPWLRKMLKRGRPVCLPQPTLASPRVRWEAAALAMVMHPQGMLQIFEDTVQAEQVTDDLCCRIPSPEDNLEAKLRREALSEEAQYVCDLILNAPAEVWAEIYHAPYKRPTKSNIARHLRRAHGWSQTATRRVMAELREYVNGIEA